MKEKKGIDARRISALRFNFKQIKQDATKQANPTTPPKLKQDKSSEVKTNQAKTPTLSKENDALIRFKNALKTLNNDNPNPTITPTIKNANNKQIQANNETLAKFENIVLTSPKYFDYTIKSVTKGSLYYEIKAFCDLKKKHELIKLLVAEYIDILPIAKARVF
ncbi:hypothetical protein [Helicobacter pylori]|uniref:hypothetical protein n=1 Tax=Helicobacter pylori TaxID=210 RepID=UPI0013CE2DF0|nr:hypothetical protein [Helicobacter pylori]